MDEPDDASPGLFASLRRLLATGLTTVEHRVQLISLELQEEKCRLVEIIICVSAVLAFGFMSLTMVTLTVVLLFWEHARDAALIGLSVFYLLVTALAARSLNKRLHSVAPPFSDSISELKKDKAWLDSRN